jgi:hypothetical protein
MRKLSVLLLLFSSLCFAAEFRVTMHDLIQGSDRILQGRVLSMSCHAGTNQYGDQLIYTDISIRADQALKGERTNMLLTIEGGTANGITLKVSDVPTFKVGEEVVVFAKKQTAGYFLSFGSQAKYTIKNDGRIRENGLSYRDFTKSIMANMRSEQ